MMYGKDNEHKPSAAKTHAHKEVPWEEKYSLSQQLLHNGHIKINELQDLLLKKSKEVSELRERMIRENADAADLFAKQKNEITALVEGINKILGMTTFAEIDQFGEQLLAKYKTNG